MRHTNNQGGYTFEGFSLIEMLVYMALLSLLVVVVINVANLMLQSYVSVQNQQLVLTSGETAMERMTREIRNANGIVGGTFGSSSGDLTLSTTDSSGAATTTEFVAASGDLQIVEGGTSGPSLLQKTVLLNSLMFYSTTTNNSKAVRIILSLKSGTLHVASSTFYDTVILRGSY